MSRIAHAVDMEVPAALVFERLLRFEELSRILPGVTAVRRVDDRTLHWVGEVMGVEIPWLIDLVEIEEERLISWSSRSGPRITGALWLEPFADGGSRVTVFLQHEPMTLVQEMTDQFGLLRRWLERSLECLKREMEDPAGVREHLPPVEELVGQ